ncbi:MAG TPA: acyl carrier protein [Candidatus Nitrosopolaris sp.]|nr:acyl carrier protein [Candidatus Nitrosopolaris sp.]
MGDARADALIEFVERNLLTDLGRRVTPDTPLLAGGVVDSMGLVLLAAFVEERFGVHLEDADLREGALTTIADVVALLDARR